MERLKITLVGLVLVLALTVAYGYGCGGGDDGDGGGGSDSVAAEADGTSGDSTGPVTNSEAADGEDGSEEESDGEDGSESEGDGADGSQGADGSSEGGGDGDGDGGDANASSEPLTKPQLLEQGDAICTKIPERYNEILKELEDQAKKEKKPKPSTAETNLKAAVPPIPEAARELEELVPPEGDEAEMEAIVAALEAAGKGLEEEPTAPLSGPKSPFDEFQKLTGKYGFEYCKTL